MINYQKDENRKTKNNKNNFFLKILIFIKEIKTICNF